MEKVAEFVKEDIEIFGANDKPRVLPAVQVIKIGNKTIVPIRNLIQAEQHVIAEEEGIKEKQLPLIALLYADPFEKEISPGIELEKSNFKSFKGVIREAIRIQKMLFEIWQRSIKIGYGNLYPHHTFYADKYGPVSRDLKPEMKNLEDNGLVKVHWARGTGETSTFELTQKGMEKAKEIWKQTPDKIKDIIIDTKNFLAFLDSKDIVEYFHTKYPEYKKIEEPDKNTPN